MLASGTLTLPVQILGGAIRRRKTFTPYMITFIVLSVRKAKLNRMSTTLRQRSFSSNASSSGVYDVAIAGAGIMGLSIAYQLKRSYPDLKVVVCEKEKALGYGS